MCCPLPLLGPRWNTSPCPASEAQIVIFTIGTTETNIARGLSVVRTSVTYKRDRVIAGVEDVAQSSARSKGFHQGACRQLLGTTGFGDDIDGM